MIDFCLHSQARCDCLWGQHAHIHICGCTRRQKAVVKISYSIILLDCLNSYEIVSKTDHLNRQSKNSLQWHFPIIFQKKSRHIFAQAWHHEKLVFFIMRSMTYDVWHTKSYQILPYAKLIDYSTKEVTMMRDNFEIKYSGRFNSLLFNLTCRW